MSAARICFNPSLGFLINTFFSVSQTLSRQREKHIVGVARSHQIDGFIVDLLFRRTCFFVGADVKEKSDSFAIFFDSVTSTRIIAEELPQPPGYG